MKKLLSILAVSAVMSFCGSSAFADPAVVASTKITKIARYADGTIKNSGLVSVMLTVTDGTNTYTETFTDVSVNDLGFFTVTVGTGADKTGTLASVLLNNDTKITTEVDPANGTSYQKISENKYLDVAAENYNRIEFSDINPMNTKGDIIYGTGDATDSYAILDASAASAGHVLTLKADKTMEWKAPSAGGGSTIIPYASGTPFTLTTKLGGVVGDGAFIGFGSNATASITNGLPIDLTGEAGTNLNYAFIMPSNGTISSVSACFSTTTNLTLVGSTISITAQLYSSTTPDNVFTPIPGAIVTIDPQLTGLMPIGSFSNGVTSGLSIPIASGTRLLMVYKATVIAGIDTATSIAGYGSAGVEIR